MPSVRVPPGVFRGEDRAMVPGRYHSTNLVRWREGNLCPIGGWDRMNVSALASVPRAGHVWTDKNYVQHRAIICDGDLYRGSASTFTNITPADFKNSEESVGARGYGSGVYGLMDFGQDDEPRGGQDQLIQTSPISYCLDNWGDEILMGTSADGRIFYWSPDAPNERARPITATSGNVPTLVQAFLATEEHHLMTFGGDGVPNRVAWSDQGNRAGWNYANTVGQAGFNDLEGAGAIYAAKKIPGGVLIFTQTSVWLCQYIGAPYFYGFRRIAEHLAPVSPQAIAVAAGRAYWMIARGFAQFASGVVSPLPCTLDLNPSEEMDRFAAPRRVTAGFNGQFNEIWWFYPSAGQNEERPENDRYVIFNFADGWWADGRLARTFFTASPIEGYPFAGAANGMLYQHERGYLDEGRGRAGHVWAEIGSISFDDGERKYTVTQAQVGGRFPQETDGSGPVQFVFSGNNYRGEAFRPMGTHVCNQFGVMNPRFTARDFSFRVEGLQDVPWSVGAVNFRATPRGTR